MANKKLLKFEYPELIEEWDFEKNKEYDLSKITIKSGKKVWWRLPYDDPKTGKHFDFEWQATVADRTSGKGCPFISSRRVWPGYNDLQTHYPLIAEEWHHIKNGDLRPENVTPKSNKVVWWKLPYDDPKTGKHFEFEWQARIDSRVGGLGCPVLTNAMIWEGYNDLMTMNPRLSAEWDHYRNGEIRPNNVSEGSNYNAWWLCPQCGHSWQAKVYSRKDGNGCPNCAIEMNTSFPEAATYFYVKKIYPDALWRSEINGVELDVFIPSIKTGIEYDGKHWHFTKKQRDIEKNIVCKNAGIRLIRIREMLEPLNDYSKDFVVKDGSKSSLCETLEKVVTLISKEHIDIDLKRDEIEILNLFVKGRKERSLLEQYPEIAKEWHPTKNGDIMPDMVTVGSHKSVWWYLEYEDTSTDRIFAFEWKETIKNRVAGNNCPYLTGKRVYPGFNDLKTKYPKIAAEWHPTRNGKLKPENVSANSNKKVWWYLPYNDENGKHFDFEWEANINNRVKGQSCPFLSGQKVWPGYNDLQTRRPYLVHEWLFDKNGSITPNSVSVSSNKKSLVEMFCLWL